MMRLLLLLVLLSLPLGVLAQDGIHRCMGADGNPLFTDQPCAALQATPVTATPRAPADAAAHTAPAAPPPILCAASVAELRESVLQAFANRDPNRLAGLMLWGGYGQQAVVADIRSLTGLMQRPLLEVTEADETATSAPSLDPMLDLSQAPGASASAHAPAAPARGGERQLIVRTTSDDGSGNARETRFSVVRRSGCLWLQGAG
jgi:hypothetical protein